MSDTTQEQVTYRIRAYHETPEHAALRGETTPPREPIAIAREQLAMEVRRYGEIIDLGSIKREESEAVIVDDGGDYRTAHDGETPTGHIVLWSCTAHPSVPTDGEDPVLDVEWDEDNGTHVAHVPEPWASVGGAARIRHNLDGEVTVLAYRKADDDTAEGVGYLFAADLDPSTVHVEFYGGTHWFTVDKDD